MSAGDRGPQHQGEPEKTGEGLYKRSGRSGVALEFQIVQGETGGLVDREIVRPLVREQQK